MDDLILDAETLFGIADVIDGYCAKQREVINVYYAQIMALESEWRDDETFGSLVDELTVLKSQAIKFIEEIYTVYPKYFRERAQKILERPVYDGDGTTINVPNTTIGGGSETIGYRGYIGKYANNSGNANTNARSSDTNDTRKEAIGDFDSLKENSSTKSAVGEVARRDTKDGLISAFADKFVRDSIVKTLKNAYVYYLPINKCENDRTTDEIISELGGGDCTRGSCSSLAFAYAGNKAGYIVLDFRGGTSREYFSLNDSISKIARMAGVKSKIVYGTNDIKCANKLLRKMEQDKEYYFATGHHAAIVRKNGAAYEYLELQSAIDNGWHPLTQESLVSRFACGEGNEECPNFLIDVDSLANSASFIDILGYINTPITSQYKGESGYVK